MDRILVIEDDTPVRENICEMLRLEGYQVEAAADGQEGIYRATMERFNLIICDIRMPILDGYEVLKHLRQHPATLSIPLILLTAKTEREDQRTGMNLGADDYLTKPFTRSELLTSIRSRLARKNDLDQEAVMHHGSWENSAMLQLPLEFAAPLRNIKDLADQLITLRKVDDISEIIQIGQHLDEATRTLMRTTQKYQLLGDLEKRAASKSDLHTTLGKTDQADLIFLEVLEDHLREVHASLLDHSMQSFTCGMDAEDYFKFAELISDDVCKNADPSQAISVTGNILDPGEQYQIHIRYTTKHQEWQTMQFYQYKQTNRSRELSINQRIAVLLNCRVEYSQLNDEHELRIKLPTV